VVHWQTTPVVVYVDDTIPQVLKDAVRSAALQWNVAVGAELLSVYELSGNSGHFVYAPRGTITVSSAELGTMLVDISDYNEEALSDFAVVTILGENELTWNTVTGRAGHCMILFDYQVNSETAVPVAIHELGHCLGLSHDRDSESIMYWSAVVSPRQHIMPDDADRIGAAIR
jgi:hypothetical protein